METWTGYFPKLNFLQKERCNTDWCTKQVLSMKKLQTWNFVGMVKYLELRTLKKNYAAACFTKKDRTTCIKQVLLVLNENKISKPKSRRNAFETHGRVFKVATGCFGWISLNFGLCLKTKQNVLICHGRTVFSLLGDGGEQ